MHCLIVGDGPFSEKSEIKEYSEIKWLLVGDELAKEFVERCMMRDEDERLGVDDLLRQRWFNEPQIGSV